MQFQFPALSLALIISLDFISTALPARQIVSRLNNGFFFFPPLHMCLFLQIISYNNALPFIILQRLCVFLSLLSFKLYYIAIQHFPLNLIGCLATPISLPPSLPRNHT